MSSECNHPYDLTNNYEGVCLGCNRHLSEIVEELKEELAEFREDKRLREIYRNACSNLILEGSDATRE